MKRGEGPQQISVGEFNPSLIPFEIIDYITTPHIKHLFSDCIHTWKTWIPGCSDFCTANFSEDIQAGSDAPRPSTMELGGAFTIFLALCLSCLLILIAWKQINKGGMLPPGPTPIPFLGNLIQIRTDATFQSLMKVSLSLRAGSNWFYRQDTCVTI